MNEDLKRELGVGSNLMGVVFMWAVVVIVFGIVVYNLESINNMFN